MREMLELSVELFQLSVMNMKHCLRAIAVNIASVGVLFLRHKI